MPRELIAPAQEQVAFENMKAYPCKRMKFGLKASSVPPNTVRRWHHIRGTQVHAVATMANIKSFAQTNPGWCTILQDLATCALAR